MRVVEPAPNIEFRDDRHGHAHVVFSFPYRADIVDAVRAIPGRRFDWDAKEWWAPQADVTAPYVKGLIERYPSLRVADPVTAWLAEATDGWVGRVSAARLRGKGAFVLETIAGELPDELAAGAEDTGGRLWLGFSQETAEALLELRGARLDKRALRCATKLQVDQAPAPATLALVDSVGESRFTLDVNWDPDTIPAFLALPACEAHGRSLPIDPYLVEPLEHYLRTHGVEVAANAGDVLARLRVEHDEAIVHVRRSRAHDGEALATEGVLGGELRPFQRAGVAYVLRARRTFLADEQGLGKTVQALAALEEDDAFPAVVVCPASLKLNWQREAAALAAAPLHHGRVGHRHGRGLRRPDDRQLRHHPRPPHAARAAAAEGAGARRVALRQEPARQAHAGGAAARGVARAGRAAARADRHAGDEPRRGADPAAAHPRPAGGLRLGRALRAALPGHRGGGADPLAPAPQLLRPPLQGRRAARSSPPSARSPCPSRSTTSATTGWPRRT